jgi:hypothetical protein
MMKRILCWFALAIFSACPALAEYNGPNSITAGTGISLTTSPCIATCTISVTNPSPGTSTSGDLLTFSNATGGLQDSGTLLSSLATTASLAAYAPLASPTFTGVVNVPAGSVSAPGLIGGTSGTGWEIGSAGITGSIGGNQTVAFSANTLGISGTSTFGTVAIQDLNSGSPATGINAIIAAQSYNNAGTPVLKSFGLIEGSANTITSGGELGQWQILAEGCGGTAGTSAACLTLTGVATTPTAVFGVGMSVKAQAAVLFPGLASSSTGTTGTLCWTTSTGNVNVDTTTTCLLSLLKLKDLHGPITGNEALHDIMAAQPEWITWKKNTPEYAGDKQVQPSLIADQLAKVDKRLVAYDPKGALHGVRYQELTAVLIAGMQQQQREIASLKSEVSKLERRH